VITLKTYINPKSIGRKNYELLIEEFPQVTFLTLENAKEADSLFVMPSFLQEVSINECPNVTYVQLLMAGYDMLDLNMFFDRNIVVSNARDIFSKSIAEEVLTKILVLNRDVKHFVHSANHKLWLPVRNERELTGHKVGILGTGSIGKEVAKRLRGFECKIIGYKAHRVPSVEYFDELYFGEEGLEYVLRNSDYVILALPLNKDTYKLLNKERLSYLKEDALFINVARGNIVDEEALVERLSTGKLRGAGLDVFETEPLPENSQLWFLPNVYMTPHNASSSEYMRDRLYELIRINLSRIVSGQKPIYIIEKE